MRPRTSFKMKRNGRKKRPLLTLAGLSVIVLAVLIPALSHCGAAAKENNEDLLGFLQGSYGLIGKRPLSGDTYSGTVTIKRAGDKLEILRCVGGTRLAGEGSIVLVTADKISNLRIRWREAGDDYEGLYEIHSDVENYARLSGPYVRAKERTRLGWELLYVDRNGGQACR